jgi:S1-C subfamily serine protease
VQTAPSATGAQAMLEEGRQFVFRVRNEACLATGTAFSADGQIVTNRHVAAGAPTLDVSTWDGNDFQAQVSVHSDSTDLALLDGIPPDETFATLASSDPQPGEAVWVVGYPLGDQLSVSAGKVLAVVPGAQFGVAGDVLELNNHVAPGNSGSPLLDTAGAVVGVAFAIDTANGDGLALPVSDVRALFGGGAGDASPLPCAE